MKRMHIHVGVDNLDHSIEFYSALFGERPVGARQRDVERQAIARRLSRRLTRRDQDHADDRDSQPGDLVSCLLHLVFPRPFVMISFRRSDP